MSSRGKVKTLTSFGKRETMKEESEVSWTEIKNIKVQKNFNLRGKVKPDPELVERIKKDGVLHPIHIRNAPDGSHYLLVDGERRYQASKEAGLENIPVILHDPMSDEEAMLFSYRANEAQKPWTQGQKFRMFLKLSKLGWDPERIGKELLVSHKTVLEYLKTKDKGSGETQAALAEGEVSSRVSSRVANFPKKTQGAVLSKVKGKGTRDAIATVRKEEREKGVVLPGPKPRPYPLAENVEERCKELEKLLRAQLDLSPRHKVLLGQMRMIEVLKGKKSPEDIFPDFVLETLRSGHGG